MANFCAFCQDPIESDEPVTFEEDDDPFNRVEGDVAHDECLRRHRVAVEQTSYQTVSQEYSSVLLTQGRKRIKVAKLLVLGCKLCTWHPGKRS